LIAASACSARVKRGSTVDSTQRFTFNYLNQLTDVRLFTGAATTGGHRVALSRYQDGAISAVTPHNDVTPTSTGAAVTRAKMVYGRDGAGQLSSITGTAARFDYEYDRLGRIQEMMTDGQTATKKTYQYWADNQIKQENSATFAYDDNYNRTDSSRVTGSGNRQKSDSAWTYEYDERGNEVKKISKGSAGRWEYVYDHRNRLVSAKQYSATSGGTKQHDVVYNYDAANRRIEKKDDTNNNTANWETQERYAVNGVNAVLVTNLTGAFSARYMFGDAPDEVLAEELSTSEGFRWLVADHQGSVRRVLKADGTTMRSVNYDAFGNVATSTATDTGKLPRFMYTGQQFDAETGLGYFDARYYASDAARFLSTDPAKEGSNLYAYVQNNPLNRVDPTGLIAIPTKSGIEQIGNAYSMVKLGYQMMWADPVGSYNDIKKDALSGAAQAAVWAVDTANDPAKMQSLVNGADYGAKTAIPRMAASLLELPAAGEDIQDWLTMGHSRYSDTMQNFRHPLTRGLEWVDDKVASSQADPGRFRAGMFVGDAAVQIGLSVVPFGDLFAAQSIAKAVGETSQIARVLETGGSGARGMLEMAEEGRIGLNILDRVSAPRITGVQANKAAGDAVRDLIAAREAPALIEQNFTTVGGVRRVDVLKLGDGLTWIESKVGRTSLDSRVRQELARDWWLRRQGQLDRVVWEFTPSETTGVGGPTAPLLEKLQKLNFDVRIHP
jgi:RHS repeat-associated protein